MEHTSVIIGFTGTRDGMSPAQRNYTQEFVRGMVSRLSDDLGAFIGLHGDCIGADADFNQICKGLGIERHQRPCTFANMRAYTDAEEIAEPVAPMKRNQEIVDDCDLLIACPPTFDEVRRSGTWATIRMARKANKQIVIVFPDGSVVHETPKWLEMVDA